MTNLKLCGYFIFHIISMVIIGTIPILASVLVGVYICEFANLDLSIQSNRYGFLYIWGMVVLMPLLLLAYITVKSYYKITIKKYANSILDKGDKND